MQTQTNKPWQQWYEGRLKNLELPEKSIYSLLKNTTEQFPSHIAINFEDTMTDYTTLKKQVDKLAGTWKELGFEKGERIGLMMANHPLYIVSYYAAQALGLIVVQVNPMYTPRELRHILTDCQMQYLVFDQQASKIVEEVKEVYPFKACMSVDDRQNDSISIREMIESGKEIEHPVHIHPREDIAVIQYTGGTTGKMKGAMLTHYNLTSNVSQITNFFGDTMSFGKEITLTATPLYHIYGMNYAMNLSIYLGGTILLFAKFDLQSVLENIKKYRPSIFPGVPKMYSSFVSQPNIEQYGLDCLKICTCASAPLPVEVIKHFEELTGVHIGEGYGLSEASPSVHRNPPFYKRKVGSIGIPYQGTDCMIVDEQNNELEANQVGELLIKGPQIMKGYWNKEEETRQVLQNGWFHTGDLAKMDEEGYFYIVGRKKEMIIVGGFNVYPQEVEEVLYGHPNIKEVAVVGIPDPEFGEMVKAFLVPKDNALIDGDVIKEYCSTKLTKYKIPKEFEIIEELPRNTVGKILKRILVKEELNKRKLNIGNLVEK